MEPLKSTSYMDTFPEVAGWLERIDARSRVRPGATVPPRTIKIAAAVAVVVLVGAAGFVPIRDLDTVGHLIFWKGDPGNLKAMEAYSFPSTQVVHAPEPNGSGIKFALLLPGSSEDRVEEWVDGLRGNSSFREVELVALEEEIDRPLYEAFLANLPASLSGRGRLDPRSLEHERFRNLATPHLGNWFDTETVRYGLSSRTRGDTTWFSIIPGRKDPTPTPRELMFDRYFDLDRAIDLLTDEDPRVQTARDMLKTYHAELEKEIYGDSGNPLKVEED